MKAPSQPALARSVRAYLETHVDQMLALLGVLVRAESPTDVPEAQADVQDALSRLLQTIGYTVRSLPGGEESGGHLYARPTECPKEPPVQLLVDHCDTVPGCST